MRNGHRRMRGRSTNNGNHNNRRGPNPLTRSYESNGPDVKIRGTAQHVVEKYTSLARDAQGSGDPVMAENYLQHAEHYFRIIAAAQAQFGVQNYQRQDEDSDEGMEDDDGDEESIIAVNQPQPYVQDFPQRKPVNPAQQGEPSNSRFPQRDRGERTQRFQQPDQRPANAPSERPEGGDHAQLVRRSRYGMTPRNPMEGAEETDMPVVRQPRRELIQDEPLAPRPHRVERDVEPELPAFLMATRRTAPRRPRPTRPEDVVDQADMTEE